MGGGKTAQILKGGENMTTKEKLVLIAEMERRNDERWKMFAESEAKKGADIQVSLHEVQPCA
mgnify:CR=1 FL=1